MLSDFKTKVGGSVVHAEGGQFIVGANPFGFACSDCGRVHDIAYDLDGEDLLLSVTGNDEETDRFRAFMATEGGKTIVQQLMETVESDRELLANWSATGTSILMVVCTAVELLRNAQAFHQIGQHDLARANIHTAMTNLEGLINQKREVVLS